MRAGWRRRSLAACLLTAPLIAPSVAGQTAPAAAANTIAQRSSRPQDYGAVLDRYCVGCHNQRTRTAGVILDPADLDRVAGNAAAWEKVVWKLRSASMPPVGMPRPNKATYDGFASALETTLDRAAAVAPNPGRKPALHRLNRAEYRNAIRDLLALDVDLSGLLPSDSGSYGFDNIAGVLSMSPALMERYLSVAERVTALAVGAGVPPTSDTFRVAGDLLQDERLIGLPFGTRGGTGFDYTFPEDGDYEFRLRLGRAGHIDVVAGLDDPSEIEISIDGERVQTVAIGGNANRPRAAARSQVAASNPDPDAKAADARLVFRLPVRAGYRRVVVSFIRRTGAYVESTVEPYRRVNSGQGGDSRYQPYLASVTLSGPFNVSGPGDTPSRRRIFICRPDSTLAAAASSAGRPTGGSEEACATRILAAVARRAYRRPVTDTEVQALVDFYRQGRTERSFDYGIEYALRRVLVDPEFLFRVERDPVASRPNTPYQLGDLELASRLSFFLWSSIPDDQLLDLAARGRLKNPVVLEQQVRRMLADPRADALVSNFGGQWLYLRNIPSLVPNSKLFPDFDDGLRQAMRQETELFFQSIVREDRSVLDFLRADYTFVNERLARHYGIPNIYGSDFRRVTVSDPNRGGLLGQAGILMATSEPTRTSPVRRGKWVLENLLGAPPPPPPPDVPALKETDIGSRQLLSMRAQMAQHRASPACASCHKVMDPIGLSLENFDAVGRWRMGEPWMLTAEDEKWRRNEADAPIDGAGALPDGTTFSGPAGLKKALLANPDQFVATLSEKLMIYALGRGVEPFDRPALRTITRDAAAADRRFSSVVLGIVKSLPFQMRLSDAQPKRTLSNGQP